MAKKMNRVRLQPFVPKGHGDESGEYREHGFGGASGSGTTTTTKKEPPKKELTGFNAPKKEETKPNDNGGVQPKQQESQAKEPDFYYFKKGKEWRMIRPKHLDTFKRTLIGTTFLTPEQYQEAIKQEQEKRFDKFRKPNKRKKMENKWKEDSGFKGIVNFSGLSDENTRDCLEAFDMVSKDFPFIKNTLRQFGTNTGIQEEGEFEIHNQQESSDFKSKVEEYRKKLEKWNHREFGYEEAEKDYLGMLKYREYNEFGGHYWGATSPDGGRIRMRNTNYKKLINEGYNNIQPPRNIGCNMKATAVHELGHAVTLRLFPRAMFESTFPSELREFYEENRNKVSRYGSQNIDEFTSECFASHYTEGNNEVANKMVELVKKYARGRI